MLENNLDNIQIETDLFGNKIEKLSMRDRIGFLPTSVWVEDDWPKVKELKHLIGDSGQTRQIELDSSNFIAGERFQRTTKTTYNTADGLGSRDNNTSIFNPHLAQMILSAYCPSKANIYDPFAGGGTRGFVAAAMGHNYCGVELREIEVKRINKKMDELYKRFTIVCGDSRYKYYPEDNFNFAYTCPPYYNLEIYSTMNQDLSAQKTYSEFIEMLKQCFRITFDSLQIGSLFVCVVGNFRDEKTGELIHFSGDTIKIAKEIGFTLHDEVIWQGASGSAMQRCGQFEANRKSVRIHEYILIFKK